MITQSVIQLGRHLPDGTNMRSTRSQFLIIILIICTSLFWTNAVAQLPPVQTNNGIDFISGGIGSDESQALRTEAKWWPVAIEFSQHTPDGDVWISDIRVKIFDANHRSIFEAIGDGPILLLKLQPGSYEVAAQHQSVIRTKPILITGGAHQRISISW